MSNPRAKQVADRIHVIVAERLRKLKDPRLGFVTVTDVRITGDLREAKIFYTVLGEDADRTSTAAALESATGLLRSEVSSQLEMRHAPTLAFEFDGVPEHARSIDDALARAKEADEALAAAREGKEPAGEADPYRPTEADTDTDE
jgi:ribosome-binding factor A